MAKLLVTDFANSYIYFFLLSGSPMEKTDTIT